MPATDKTALLSVAEAEFVKLQNFITTIDPALALKEVYFPAKGYKWNALKRYNADLRTCLKAQ
ncbi:hypothetical protein GG681_03380 [Epibacterium sp. SM1969]|uniref:Uncharacterized protein n=1 Tax=Tritonibacter aquimaris TaxID=2663379 RepID=A0A844AKJ0_9RHOB|nr:hypothetical protein [Tritonibacter aquimaris]MQY41669.1 hypothetical protein [Tritonibacter aquimaris]